MNGSKMRPTCASSHKWEAYRRRRFCRFSRRERRAYLNPYVRSEQRRKSAKAPSALRVGLKRVRLRRCSFVTYRTGYAPHSRLESKTLLKPTVCLPLVRRCTRAIDLVRSTEQKSETRNSQG